MKNDQSFIQIFLDFLNDKTANGVRFAANLKRHRYVIEGEKQGFPFNPARGDYDWEPLRFAMSSRLMRKVAGGASIGYQRQIIAQLNSLQLKIPIVDLTTGAPVLGPDGEPVVRRIVALATFEYGADGVQFGGQPIVNGLEFACWYALLLISRIPNKVRRCTRQDCQKFFNEERTQQIGFCSKSCSKAHNDLMQETAATQ